LELNSANPEKKRRKRAVKELNSAKNVFVFAFSYNFFDNGRIGSLNQFLVDKMFNILRFGGREARFLQLLVQRLVTAKRRSEKRKKRVKICKNIRR